MGSSWKAITYNFQNMLDHNEYKPHMGKLGQLILQYANEIMVTRY